MKINSRKIDLLVVMVIIVISAFLILKFELKFLISGILYLLIPALYLLLRKTQDVKNILIASLCSIGPGFIFSFLHTLNQSWFIPQDQLIFSYRIFNILPIDEIFWYFLFTFAITTFYEHFIEKKETVRVSKNFKYAILSTLFIFIGILILFFLVPNLLKVNYSYLIFSIIAIFPLLYLFTKKPFFINKFAKIAIVFFFLFFLCEFTALKTGQWIFPGQYVGMVDIFNLRLPFEEIFFWIMISSMGFFSYYEIFVDDEK